MYVRRWRRVSSTHGDHPAFKSLRPRTPSINDTPKNTLHRTDAYCRFRPSCGRRSCTDRPLGYEPSELLLLHPARVLRTMPSLFFCVLTGDNSGKEKLHQVRAAVHNRYDDARKVFRFPRIFRIWWGREFLRIECDALLFLPHCGSSGI